jgi:peroxiredoxin Q/BCP
MDIPKIGNLAPAFTLLNQNGQKVSLKDFKGKKNILLYFYPRALTPGCTAQACGVRDSKKEFSALDTIVLGVSPDPQTKLQKFIDKHGLNFDLLADEDHLIAEKYGVWDLKKFMGREFMGIVRTSFLIDRDGRLRYVMDKVKTKTHHQDAIAYIEQHF